MRISILALPLALLAANGGILRAEERTVRMIKADMEDTQFEDGTPAARES